MSAIRSIKYQLPLYLIRFLMSTIPNITSIKENVISKAHPTSVGITLFSTLLASSTSSKEGNPNTISKVDRPSGDSKN